ncbi:glycosyltransferase [Desulfuromonas acetoxidans]|uniref:Glycosyl transferase, group 1 n=1 Tax=Desulfuromonas acetoxidans (strain DSM 684 / 11070) TaxID=281689 RepID=Q1K146_DESA6|nr:glycosyltransferase [Desulfuromonas acetoxidans]EAT16162.1 glycosyl transferase, group 1 [Desulfuromonas acetoxidans DSM 684]MBF0645940.1 glycosyltransferase [Desulfuromonas acetoxidans]NVD25485.1 glycosyltransferase [Desulfuromonas acetoxidans]NVE17565.1 glycosyltransferase [Desulfuromonas acetoxidans]
MKLMQILLSQSEAGAETYFEKVAAAFAKDDVIEQRLIIEAQPSREVRLHQAEVDFRTLPMGRITKPLFYNQRLKREVDEFDPDLILTWVNRASRKCPSTSAVVVGRLGGYYDITNYRKCDHLIVNTPDLVRHVTRHDWPQHDVSMISNFGELLESLDVPESLPSIPDGHRVLLSLGRLHEKKAQDVLIRALPDIPQATLLIAGDGELKSSLVDLAASLGVADRVHLLGLRKDVRALFALADICVFPSRFEPLGNVVLEAWATGTPIVAAASQGPSWLIEDGCNGLLFDVDNVIQCAAQVNRLLADGQFAERLVEQGRRTFSQEFSMEVIIGRYKALFKDLIAKQACGRTV